MSKRVYERVDGMGLFIKGEGILACFFSVHGLHDTPLFLFYFFLFSSLVFEHFQTELERKLFMKSMNIYEEYI